MTRPRMIGASTSSVGRVASRSRHPSARGWRPDRVLVARHLARRASERGARWPRAAAAALVLRGIAGDDQASFARRLGISVGWLRRIEAGLVPPGELPARLRAIRGFVDWAWVAAEPEA